MPSMTIWLDERAYRALRLLADRNGDDLEKLAARVIKNEIVKTREYDDVLPPGSLLRGQTNAFL